MRETPVARGFWWRDSSILAAGFPSVLRGKTWADSGRLHACKSRFEASCGACLHACKSPP